MSQLTPAESREFLKSMDTEFESVGQIVRLILVGLASGSQTTACHLDVGQKHDAS